MNFRFLAPVLACLALAPLSACQTTADPATVAAVETYYAGEVDIQQAAGFSAGLASIGNEPAEELAARFADEAKARIAADLPRYMKGDKPARVQILLERASIASGAGRVLLASDSYVDALVSIVDTQTGATVAARRIRAADIGAKNSSSINGIPIGGLISVAVNASNSTTDRRMKLIVDAFAKETGKWLAAR